MIEKFGTEEYGNNNDFSVICNKCGKEAWAVPTHHYSESINGKIAKITFEFRCSCGNKFGASIHHEK